RRGEGAPGCPRSRRTLADDPTSSISVSPHLLPRTGGRSSTRLASRLPRSCRDDASPAVAPTSRSARTADVTSASVRVSRSRVRARFLPPLRRPATHELRAPHPRCTCPQMVARPRSSTGTERGVASVSGRTYVRCMTTAAAPPASAMDARAELSAAREARRDTDAAEVRVLRAALAWAVANPPMQAGDAAVERVAGPTGSRAVEVPLSAAGVPEVDRAAVAELGLALGCSTQAAQ